MEPGSFGPPPATTFEVEPTAEEIAFYRENGFLAVERLTTDEEIEWLHAVFEFIFSPEQADAPGAPVDRSRDKTGGGPNLTQAFFPEMRFPDLLRTTFHRNARRYAAALLGVAEDKLTSWGHAIRKAPRNGSNVPWHQDEAFWEPELEYHALGAWLPLHDVPVEMGCMQFIPGSHKAGVINHLHSGHPSENKLYAEDVDDSTAVACPLKAGGATFHDKCTLHHSEPNTTDRPRIAFPTEFQLPPRRRATPARRPWVDELRAASPKERLIYVSDGEVISV